MLLKKYKVVAPNGIHARSATILVNEAVKYESEVELGINDNFVDCKSIIGVMSLGIYLGAIVFIKTTGKDEEEAINGLDSIIKEHKLAEEI